MDEYKETWYATIMLALSRLRGSDAESYATMCHCSPSTFRKYVRMMVDEGLACEIAYGTRLYPDVRYYLMSEATFMFTNPARAAYLAIKEMAEDARHKYHHSTGNHVEMQRLWDKHTALLDAQRVLWYQLQVQIRLAVKCGNS